MGSPLGVISCRRERIVVNFLLISAISSCQMKHGGWEGKDHFFRENDGSDFHAEVVVCFRPLKGMVNGGICYSCNWCVSRCGCHSDICPRSCNIGAL